VLVKSLKSTIANIDDGKQPIRSSRSVSANYIEANEKLGDKDLSFRLKIARKEAKEFGFWLRLLKASNPKVEQINLLNQESQELRKILIAIINKL